MKCPICKKGNVPQPKTRQEWTGFRRKASKILRKEGFTFRQIAKYLGVCVGSVQQYLK